MERKFTAVIEKRARWHVAYVEEIPGINTQGKTLAEVRQNLLDALRLILEANRAIVAELPLSGARREPTTVEV